MTSTQSNLINGIQVRVGYMFPRNELFLEIFQLIHIDKLNISFLHPNDMVSFGFYFHPD